MTGIEQYLIPGGGTVTALGLVALLVRHLIKSANSRELMLAGVQSNLMLRLEKWDERHEEMCGALSTACEQHRQQAELLNNLVVKSDEQIKVLVRLNGK